MILTIHQQMYLLGYYHLTLNRSNWQTTHRVSGVVTTINENGDKLFVESFWVEWESDLYWYFFLNKLVIQNTMRPCECQPQF